MSVTATADPYEPQLNRIKSAILGHFPKETTPNRALLETAFADAELHHRHQVRRSGEPVIIHPFRVALLATEAGMDMEAVIIALLHDIIEDTEVTREEVSARYGEWMAGVVDGLTKVSAPRRSGRPGPAAIETYRKLLSSTVKDIRTLQVKLLDRLDNMRDLAFLSRAQQRRISQETIFMYVPMAQRLGMQDIADELTTLAFRYLYPKRFNRVLGQLQALIRAERPTVTAIGRALEQCLAPLKFQGVRIAPVYRQVGEFIFSDAAVDRGLAGFEVRVPSADACYQAMGALHRKFRVVPLSIRDYISNPKPNRYQGLESQLFIGGQPVNIVQLSEEMAVVNRRGSLAGWGGNHEELLRYYQTYLELLDQFSEDKDLRMEDVLRYAQLETLQVFTPKGDLKPFPQGSTVLDLAFAIHSDLGQHCAGALIGGKWVPRFAELPDGAMVEVVTSPKVEPARHWLEHVRTTRARLAIRRLLNVQAAASAQEVGRRLFEVDVRRLGEDPPALAARPAFTRALAAERLTLAQFHQRLGRNKGELRRFLLQHELVPRAALDRLKPPRPSRLSRYFKARTGPDLMIPEFGDGFIQLAACCSPLHGDAITGVQKESAIVIHRAECAVLAEEAADDLISVGWEPAERKIPHRLQIRAKDKAGVIYKIGKVMRDLNVSIHNIGVEREEATAQADILVETEPITSKAYRKVVARLRGIGEVERIGDSKAPT